MNYNFKEIDDFQIIRIEKELEMELELALFNMKENKEIEKMEEKLLEVKDEIKRRNLNG